MTDEPYADLGHHDPELRAAFATLLADEPTTPPVQDDVSRGLARRTRRRARIVGTVGVLTTLVLVFGVLGPWGPRTSSAPPASSPTALDTAAVSSLLTTAGWDVRNVSRVRAGDAKGPAVTTWSVSQAGGSVAAVLTVRAWDASAWPAAGRPPGGLLDACGTEDCGNVQYSTPDCASGPCWAEAATTFPTAWQGVDAGTAVVLTVSERLKLAAEVAASPIACATCDTTVRPFLTPAEQRQVVALVQQQLLTEAAPPPTDEPAGGRACTGGEVKPIPSVDPAPGPAGVTELLITVYPRNPDVDCVLSGHPSVVGLDREGAQLAFQQVDDGAPQSVRLHQGDIAVFRVASSVCAAVGGELATLRVTMPGGGDPLDVLVAMFMPIASCAVGASPSTDIVVGPFSAAREQTRDEAESAVPGSTG